MLNIVFKLGVIMEDSFNMPLLYIISKIIYNTIIVKIQ